MVKELEQSNFALGVAPGPLAVQKLCNIVRGEGFEVCLRARAPAGPCQSVEVFVDCLIDLATDPSILGRTWLGWRPWL